MMPAAELFGRLGAHRLQVGPIGRIADHLDPVLVAQNDAGPLEDAADGGIEFSGDLWLGAPNRP